MAAGPIWATFLLAALASLSGRALGQVSHAPWPHSPPAGEPVEVRVHNGWACLIAGDRREWRTPRDPVASRSEEFFLELGSGSEVELSWSGSASVRLSGVAGVFVAPIAGNGGGRSLSFRRLDLARFEVRRGRMTLTLPRGQRLLPAEGAFLLDGHVGGRVDLTHQAGAPIELDIGSRYTFPLPAGTRRPLPECVAPPAPPQPPVRDLDSTLQVRARAARWGTGRASGHAIVVAERPASPQAKRP
jgi:hypothetical protein